MTDTNPVEDYPAQESPPPGDAVMLPSVREMNGFGTFTGVFTPTVLTILGVIMYVRLGWVVGNAGLAGAMIIMGLAMGITFCTGLSLSSIATNTRIGDGGPYAIITKSLGFEVGGSIGIPLFLTRPLGIAMYIFGFREGWLWIFPDHPALVVDLLVFAAIFGLAFLSANLAFKIQYVIMAVIVASLIAIIASPRTFQPSTGIEWWGDYSGFPERGFIEGIDFWIVFAVFFPATTGILAGANMSGDLRDPRKSIARGTLWAIAVSSIIYFGMAFWAARVGTPAELTGNYNFFIDESAWGPAVLAGLLGATFSSALAGAVGGPRILMAMGDHKLLPGSNWLAHRKEGSEPRNAVMLTAGLTFLCLLVRDLNLIAPLVTMFFLITYCTINVVLLIEQNIGLVSFRPTLRAPRFVPWLGAVGSIVSMFVVNALFGLIAVATVVTIYWYIANRGVEEEGDDVRSSIFGAIAEWATTRHARMGTGGARGWKPFALIPVEEPASVRGMYGFIIDSIGPEGAVKLVGLTTKHTPEELRVPLQATAESLIGDGVYAKAAVVETESLAQGTRGSLQALQSSYFQPNLVLVRMPCSDLGRDGDYTELTKAVHRNGLGIMMLAVHPDANFGRRRTINVWVRHARDSWDVHRAFDENNLDLSLLMAYRIMRRWSGPTGLRINTVVANTHAVEAAQGFLAEIRDLARIPKDAEQHVLVGSFEHALETSPQADLNILGMKPEPDFPQMRHYVEVTNSSCLFVEDSGGESARA